MGRAPLLKTGSGGLNFLGSCKRLLKN
ncbi:hypothetical protein NC651_032796 [Populus alba x Populus x berolinensis]|nr:hypothetical protein NC651_032796 [Populus alba x Populus x berolinensis]